MAVTKGRTSTADRTSTLKVGDVAPDFELKAHNSDTPWRLSEHRGKSNVVVAFFPFAFTPV
ncbi:MAG: redoxin domain-containing protein [Candidatus Eremiobacteraeota bacterium]|nr:redoxin domain-containing protein [Candidatus Eremiobacteraeota bacterium]